MKAILAVALMLALVSPVANAEDPPWTWSGMEILGNHHVPRAEIEKMIVIPVGGDYRTSDPPFWTDACTAVESKFGFAKVECGKRPLRVFDGRKAILIVDVVERGKETLLEFRDAPTGTVPFADPEMVKLSDELSSKTMTASMAGHFYQESCDKGYLTYSDKTGTNEDVSPMTERLAQIVPPQRENLFAVLRGEKDPEQRRAAATLLNWSLGDVEKTIADAMPFLEDPDAGVRNNVSRYMIQFVGKLESKKLRRKLIDAFILQIQRPSHGDRNKGLYDLLAMAKASEADRTYIRKRGTAPVRYLAENSVVFNVKGPAEELLALLQGKS